ncbi:MAG: U32 family peptidase [Bacteroidales bacterium]|nr:U32 family peptidase [Bacteroidales bacterium]
MSPSFDSAQDKPQTVEIMSPVGSYESLYAAIQGGADSVYFGVGQLNMRSRSANNFDLNDLQKIAEICKQQNIRSYLTLNTIVYDHELDVMKDILNTAKTVGVSAVIASDLAVMMYAHSINFPVHISTQCNITNIEAVRFFAQFADVMVTARELSLEQVSAIIQQISDEQIIGPSGHLVEIEVFVHGALCMAVSGKCYLSLDNLNASANRGACLQLCRRPYKITDMDGGTELTVDNAYILSPKDLKTLDFLDKIIKAGIKVLKIEGRGRSADYVKTVTQIYKEATIAILENNFTKERLETWNEQLKTVYNRGFWDGYYLGQTLGEWTEEYGSQATKRKVYVGKITNYFKEVNVAEIKIETGQLSVGDEMLIMGETTGVYEDIISEIRVDLQSVQTAEKGVFCSIATRELVRRSDKVYRWDDV